MTKISGIATVSTTVPATDLFEKEAAAGGSERITGENLALALQALAGGQVLIDEQTPSGTGVVTFAAIPATFRDLVLIVRGRGTAAATGVSVAMTFNNDTGANYDHQRHTANNATLSGSGNVAQTSISAGSIAAASATAGVASTFTFEILDYKGTAFQKAAHGVCAHKVSELAAGLVAEIRSGFWRNAAAITEIDLTLSSGNFAAGSVVSLYGRY